MVCKVGQTCQIEYNLFHGAKDKILPTDKLPLHESTRGKDLYDYIEERCQIQPDSFKLYLLSTGKLIDLSVMKDKTMSEAGVDFSFDRESTTEQKHILLVVDPTYTFSQNQVGCFSAYSQPPPSPNHSSVWGEDNIDFKSRIKPKTCYVGLVNQAMTCYLNSLLQALYMTPEFRNALYNWEYIEKSEKDEANSIPFQLQKLFLNLQTSTKSAVETTALTKSFGWDSTEAWQQHDIQELCRVMFDALEQKFKNTEQADLINRLYEGKMTDYVKCLECGTEKSREDTFLDIPLPVRPFGSSVAYNSVEEALRAFVQYETLEGINQYHCEKCNKKCNAHKGLKFTKFPYLLTLHLKRFDFDFKTFHRIKLNDKVTFPDVLNLNSLIYSTEEKEVLNGDETTDIPTGDDNPITDDSTNHDTAACENSLPNSNHTSSPDQDDDEGIETSSNGPSTSNCVERNHENDKKSSSNVVKGPYNYELFSIMIHSGSASGGHYYAYIKDFRTQEWLCFNDQNVTQITHDDIQKTYGGGLSRSYLNGACSSTNAYMLMYRQIDPARNTLPMQVQDFPKHIQALLMKVKEKEENDKKMRERDDIDNKTADRNYYESTCGVTSRLKVYCQYPNEDKKRFDRITIQPNITLAELTRDIYKHFGLEGVVNLSQCRLVVYDSCADSVIYNFEGKENEIFDRIRGHKLRRNYLLLEIQDKDKIFEPYLCSDITTKVFVIDVPRKEFIQGPLNIQVSRTSTVRDYVQLLSKTVNIEPEDITIAIRKRGSSDHQKNVTPVTNLKFLKNDDTELQAAGFYNLVNVFVYTMKDAKHKHFMVAINEMTQQLENIITLSIKLPPTPSKEILEEYSISTSEVNSVDNEKPASSSTVHQTVENSSKENANEPQCDVAGKCNEDAKSEKSTEENQVCARNASPQLGEGEEWHTPEQSNSEDSSLSDSDKTLVGDAPEDDGFPLPYFPSSANNRGMKMLDGVELENWENVIDESEYYFKATEYTNNNKNYLKVIVDKRMLFNTFKKKLEPYVGVPSKYFKICRYVVICGETECGCLPMQFISYEDDEILSIKYGRSLQNRKFPIKVYHFYLNAAEPHKLLFDWTISKDMTVGQVKREILAELKRRYHVDIPFERCRLRKKCYVLPMEVYLNHQTCEEIKLYMHHEICLQELPDVDPVTSVDQVIVFVRRWSGGKLGLIQEIVLDENTVDEILKKLSQISDIPEKHIDVAKKRGLSHFTTYMRVPDDLDWNAFTTCVDPLAEDGSVFLYRDNRESTNETQEGYNSISFRGRYLSAATGTRYSARKEKALRIHVDDE